MTRASLTPADLARHLRRHARLAGGDEGALAALAADSPKVLGRVIDRLGKRHRDRLLTLRGERPRLRFLWEHREEILGLVREVIATVTGVRL